MTTKEYKIIEKLANQALQAAALVHQKQAEIRILLSEADIRAGRSKSYKNVDGFFKSLKLKS